MKTKLLKKIKKNYAWYYHPTADIWKCYGRRQRIAGQCEYCNSTYSLILFILRDMGKQNLVGKFLEKHIQRLYNKTQSRYEQLYNVN